MAKKRGLGRGLDALLGAAKSPEAPLATTEQEQLVQLPIEFLQPGQYQPRRDMHSEALEELAASIRQQGIMQPILVRHLGPDRYEIIAGERRWRAAQLAQLEKVPCLIREAEDRDVVALALIENLQREDLNPIEEAIALQRLQKEFSLTQQQVAEAVGKSRSGISNLLRLLQLHPEVRILLEHGDLEMGHARALLSLEAQDQCQAARQVVAQGLSVRQTESLVKKWAQPNRDEPSQKAKDPDIQRLEEKLQALIGAPVKIHHSAKGKGRLEIGYSSLDELDGILNRWRIEAG
ncbi:ParB/RepB/Spo0J family partition protein [Marinospirillum sp. MEB164]|uniref:Probable chromosome-partitioning protein ParB n=1 Tax=Marinospirillum alkalitolerans TaxID=3123374 RepID=A0ABW8PVS2_9GAMM